MNGGNVASKADGVLYRYLGDGSEFHTGIPAKHLRASDVAQLDEERRLVLSASPLYEKVETPTPAPADEGRKVERKGKAGS